MLFEHFAGIREEGAIYCAPTWLLKISCLCSKWRQGYIQRPGFGGSRGAGFVEGLLLGGEGEGEAAP